MIDRETESLWTHLDGHAIKGPMKNARLNMIPIPLMTWKQWKTNHPDSLVLSQETPFKEKYLPVRIGVFSQREAEFGDNRLPSNALVIGVEINGSHKAYSIKTVSEAGGVINDRFAKQEILVFYDHTSQTGLAYSRTIDNQILEFFNGDQPQFALQDINTKSHWNHDGFATSGIYLGRSLKSVPSFMTEWYGWSGYHPETLLANVYP